MFRRLLQLGISSSSSLLPSTASCTSGSCCRGLTCTGSSISVAAASCSSSGAASTSGRSFASEAKSMLGSAPGFTRAPMLENVAEQQMQRIKSKLEAAGQTVTPPEERSTASKVLSRVWDAVFYAFIGTAGAAAYYSYRYDAGELAEIVEETKTKPENAFFGSEYWVQVMERYLHLRTDIESRLRDFTDPTYHKLLPDMHPEMRGRVKTLVLDLDDLLVHKEWTRRKGWTIYKRPGVQDFLSEIGGFFEVVIFTDEPNSYADPVINRLDKDRTIMFRLYRPETQYHKGKHVRDLSKLNRDLSQVLFLSADPDAWQFQPENTIKLKRWDSDVNDTTLLDLIPFLQLVATRGVKDVRDVVKSYDGEPDVAKAFKQRMQQIQEAQKAAPKSAARSFLRSARPASGPAA